MSDNEINVGDARRLEVTDIKNEDDVVTDPTTLTLLLRKPNAATLTYTYGVGPVIVKDTVGNYHANFSLDVAGMWYYDWIGTGTAEFSEGGQFYVYPRRTS